MIKFAIFALTVIINMEVAVKALEEGECPQENTTCTYYFKVQEKLTMLFGKDLVYAVGGKLYKYDESPDNYTTEIPLDKVVSVDGVHRMTIAVNEKVPGPPIIVYENQTVRVHVMNLLLSDSVTIHWHGLHMKGTPWMDGVGWISQCPIGSGQSFTYEFTASPKGTFWYHSHVGAQRTNGLFGALIVRPKLQSTPMKEEIMIVGDWHHHMAEEVYIKMVYGNYIGRTPFVTTKTVDGGRFSGVPWVSALINGKGRYIDPQTGEKKETPLTQYNVTKGQKYRFRVIQAGGIYPLRVSVDNHTISLVASDGYDFRPIEVESFVINPGERFDFILTANQTVGNYWIRTVSMEVNVTNHTAEAILHYEGAPDEEPATERMVCTKENICGVLNCPFITFPENENMKCILMSELQNADETDAPPEMVENESEEHFLNFAFPGDDDTPHKVKTPGAVNGRKFMFPGVNSLTQYDEIDDFHCDKHDCGFDKVCFCHFTLNVTYGKTIQMVWLNMGSGAGWGHPIHMHGHSFYLMKMAYAKQNVTTAEIFKKYITNHPDIDCGSGGKNFCNNATWTNQSWTMGNVPGLNKHPPRKDTIIIPTGGYAVLRFKADNPGKWFIHCHIEVHALDGMAMIMSEAVENMPPRPKGFPVCNNFYNDPTRDYDYIKNHQQEEKVCKSSGGTLMKNALLVVSFGVIALSLSSVFF